MQGITHIFGRGARSVGSASASGSPARRAEGQDGGGSVARGAWASSGRRTPITIYLAAGLFVACGVIHFAVAPTHLEHSWIYGGLFLLAGAGQTALGAALLVRPSQGLYAAGILVNVGIIGAYVVTRTWGVPFAEVIQVTQDESIALRGDPEPVGPLDMEVTVSELVIIVALVSLMQGAWRRWTVNLLLLAGVALWTLRLAGVLEAPLP